MRLDKEYIVVVPCMAGGARVDYRDTGLAALEKELKANHPEVAGRCGDGWTRRVDDSWACASCIEQGLALSGDPFRQKLASRGFFFAYIDRSCGCRKCHEDFVFSAAEQKFWFEERGFRPEAIPLHCAPCRRDVRRPKVANRKLSECLPKLDPSDWRQLREIGELYSTVGAGEQALLYLRRAKNRCDVGPDKQALLARIADLQPQP